MWTPATRKKYTRPSTRYQTDLTDAQWRVIEPLLRPAKTTGRPRKGPMREICNAIFYLLGTGCQWRQMPRDLPPWSTVYRWFAAWRDSAVLERINHAPRVKPEGRLWAWPIASAPHARPVRQRRSSTARA